MKRETVDSRAELSFSQSEKKILKDIDFSQLPDLSLAGGLSFDGFDGWRIAAHLSATPPLAQFRKSMVRLQRNWSRLSTALSHPPKTFLHCSSFQNQMQLELKNT